MRSLAVGVELLGVLILVFVSRTEPSFADGKIAFTSDRNGNYDIFIMDEYGKHIETITEDAAMETDPSWSPDGGMIVFSRWWGFIYGTSVDKRKPKLVTNGTSFFLLLSPDGSKIAFVEEPQPRAMVLWLSVMDLDGRNRKRLRQMSDLNDEPHTWSPDGRQIAFCEQGGLYVIDIDTRKWERIACRAPNGVEISAIDVDWSPAGGKLAIASYGDMRGIWIVNRDGSHARRLTRFNDRSPEWSPDGTQIAFHSLRDGDWDIYIMDANGQNVRCLTDNTASDLQPAWFRPIEESVIPRSKLTTIWGNLKNF